MDEQQNDEQPEETAPEAEGEETQSEAQGEVQAEGQGEAESETQPGEAPGAPPPPLPGPGGAEAPPLPPELQAANASKDERSMAMIAHLLGLVGFLGPLILYLVKKDEASEYVRFHMKQSMWFQIWANVAGFVLAIVSIPLMYVCIGFLTFLLAGAVFMAALIYAIIGAVQVSGGKDFEYLWVGPWVRQSMM